MRRFGKIRKGQVLSGQLTNWPSPKLGVVGHRGHSAVACAQAASAGHVKPGGQEGHAGVQQGGGGVGAGVAALDTH